ncbi:MAG: alpha/beta hydrolase [Candidatus Eremiobacteraeota bacterium]|nr:alpha/beta hydrolase [Candidatus Eremiobacteraeota bacterium]
MREPLRRRDFTALLGAAVVAGALPGCSRRSDAVSTLPEAPASYDDAVRLIRGLIARDAADAAVLPAAIPRLYVHDKPVQHAVVLFHGFTNCPQQFDELAQRFHARGCNVYVPRIPHHGLKDRLTRDLAGVTVDELADFATFAFALTRPLGATVSALGLSLGGTMVQWLAQTQPVDLAVPIAPFLIPYPLPPFIGQPAMRLLATLPSMYFWWDFHIKEKCLPHYAYPGYPTHALARIVFFGNVIFAAAERAKPSGRRCVLVLGERDNAIDNGSARHLTELWNARGAGYTELLLTGLGPRHDVIDPTTYPRGRTAVYPKLEALVLDAV